MITLSFYRYHTLTRLSYHDMVTGYDNVSQSHDTVMKSGQHYYENMIMYIYILYSHNKIAQARMLISVSNFAFEV
jgi:hypothetical protein